MNEKRKLTPMEKVKQMKMVQAAFKKMGFDKVPGLMANKNYASLKLSKKPVYS